MKLGNIIIFAENIRVLTDFYQTVIGLEPDDNQPFPEHRFFRFNTGACKLCIHSGTKPNGGRQKIVFHVESVRQIHETLRNKKLKLRPLKPEGGLACFDVRDPEGNRIQFWGPV